MNPPGRPGPEPPPGAGPEEIGQWIWLQQTHAKAYEAWEGVQALNSRVLEHVTESKGNWGEAWRRSKELRADLDCLDERVTAALKEVDNQMSGFKEWKAGLAGQIRLWSMFGAIVGAGLMTLAVRLLT